MAAWIPAAIIGGTTLASAYSGKKGAQAAGAPRTTNQTSWTTPYSGGNQWLDSLLNERQSVYDNPPDLMPNYSMGVFGNLANQWGGGGGTLGQEGIMGMLNKFGGGGGNLGKYKGQLKDFQVNLRPELQDVIGGKYMDLDSNPYVQERVDYFQNEAGEDFARALPNVTAQFGAGGRYGSGAMGDSIAQATEQFGETTQGTISGFLGDQLNQERDRMTAGLAMASQLDAAGRSDLAGVIRSQIASRTAVLQSKIGAAAALLANSQNNATTRGLGLLGGAGGIDQMINQAKLDPRGALDWLTQGTMGILGGFGQHRTTGQNVVPGPDPLSAALQGAFGGGGGSYAYGRDQGWWGQNPFGGGGGKGGGGGGGQGTVIPGYGPINP